MKKNNRFPAFLLFFAAFFTAIISSNVYAQTCNQVEILYTAPDCFERDHQDPGGATQGKTCKEIGVCVSQPYTYTSSVTGTGWTYSWSVTGPATVVINPNTTSPGVNIIWPQVGIFILTLTATDPSGNVFTYCLKVNVKEKPNANFTFTPNNVCAGSIISFTGTTTFSSSFMSSWNFGDPSSGSNNYTTVSGNTMVTHQYNSPGTYTVTLIAYSVTTVGGGGLPNEPPSIKVCCADTITKRVTILPGTLKIECISTVCAGDTVKYTAVGCPNPNWLAPVGGTILSSSGNTVTIVWGNGNPQGQIQAQCPGGCIASVPVPIIPTNPIIVGNTSPCTTATTSYSLPVLPGTFYNWTLTNTTTSTNYNNLLNAYPDNNTVWINWALAPAGTYQLTINLDNKHICCSSSGSLTITPSQTWTAFMDMTICKGSSANLMVSPTAGTFSWTILPTNTGASPLTGPGPTFNPTFTIPGVYTVQVVETANTYCNSGISNPQQIKVTVLNIPTPGNITGSATACPGSPYTYTMSSGAPSGYHYYWSITGGTGSFQPGNLVNSTGNSATIVWTGLPGTISVILQANGFPPCPSVPVTFTVTQASVGTISGPLNVCVDGTGNYTLTGGTLPSGEPVTWSISPSSHGTIISGQGTNSITVLWHGQPGVGPWGPVTINATTACGNANPLTGIMIYPKFNVSITKTGIDICQPGGVTLTVTGAPSGSTYLWSPGGQTTSSISNITTAGTYSVIVTKGGCSDTASYIVEDPFSVLPLSCGVGVCNGTATNELLQVQVIKPTVGTFTYQWYSGTYPSGTIISGATSASYTAPSHGSYYVIVTYGTCQKHVSFTVKKVCCPNINNPQITTVTRNSCNSYTFTGTTPNPTGATITWNFGDGNTQSGTSGVPVTHVYASAGIYCVTFCIGPPSPNPTNCTGNCAATTVTVPIEASFTYKLGCNGCLNVTNTSTTISNPSFISWMWNFGDGNTSPAQTPGTHCYANPGTYTIKLIVYYNDGTFSCSDTATQTVTYTPLAISVNPSPVCTGVPTLFSSTPGGFQTYAWNFGDGFTAYTATSTHIYNTTGNMNVTLAVTDALGNTCNASTTVNVFAGIASCTILPGYICPGGSATLSTTNVSGYTYLWEKEISLNVFAAAPGVNTSNTYTTSVPGFYHVVVTNANGCKCISNKVEVKTVPKPKAIIAAAPSSKLCGPGNIMLTSSNHLAGYTSEWYANGNYGSQLSSSPMYMAFGVGVTTVFNLILTNEYGCKDTCSMTITVNPIPALPVITSNPTLCEGVPITLTVTNYTSNISWNTGATTISTTVYSAGTYTATYTDPVTGCKSSSNIKVNRRPPTDLFPHFCDSIPCTCRDSTGNFTIYAPKPLIGAFSSNYAIQWYFNGSPVGTNGANPLFTPAQTGTYHIVVTDPMTGCKDTSDTYTIVVPPCDSCDCKGSKWGPKGYTTQNQSKPFNCNQSYTVNCNQPVTVQATYICPDPNNCPANVSYVLQPPSGSPLTGNAPLTFTPSQTGIYTVTLYGWCGTAKCDSCVVRFRTTCIEDSTCCPYSIKVDTTKITTTYNQQYNATVINENFVISGLAGVPLTEVRAEVLSYTITDNYNKECMRCVNLPYTWASVLSATNLGAPPVPPKITMYNSTVHPFIPTGPGLYQNPREVVWNNGSTFIINNNTQVGMNFLLPPPPTIDCCEFKGRICVRFTFRDENCKECEVIACFEFLIKSKKP